MKTVFTLLLAAVFAVPLFALLPSTYQDTKYYNRYGKAIKECEAKLKAKKIRPKAKEKLQKKMERLKEAHSAAIKEDKDILLARKAELEAKLKDPDENIPAPIQKALDNCNTDIAKLDAFAKQQDYKPADAKKADPKKGAAPKPDAGKADSKKAPAVKPDEIDENSDSPF